MKEKEELSVISIEVMIKEKGADRPKEY